MSKKVQYAISAVTVYPDRARLFYKGQIDVEAGYQTLILDELPLSMELDSVRVGGKGSSAVQILGVDVTRQHYAQSPSIRVSELEDQIEELFNKLHALADKNAGYEAQAEHIQGMRLETREYARGLSRGRTSVEDQAILLRFLMDQDEEIRTAQREIAIKRRDLEHQLDKLREELKELQSLRPRQRYQARVGIEAAAAGQFQVELSCILRASGWQPLYDIRLVQADSDHLLEVSLIAQVKQNTGQDWDGVELALSTARPALNQRMPELKPWFVDEYRPPQPRQMRSRSSAQEPSMAVMAAPLSDPPLADIVAEDFREAELSTAEVKNDGAVVTFAPAGRWDIPSDGSPVKMPLSSFTLDPKLDYIAVPRHTDAVYRRATVKNSGDSPLLSGAATLFVSDEFIGKTEIAYTPVEGELELLLGVEERIEISRELAKRDVDKRLLRENRLVRYAYDIKLKNLLLTAANVEVQDQIPVSKHEQIKVKMDQARPEPSKKSDLNILEWQLVLESGEEIAISYEYIVEHPRSLRVYGLAE